MSSSLKKVRVQLINPATGSVIEDVDVKTAASAVNLDDGTDVQTAIEALQAGAGSGSATTDDAVVDVSLDATTGVFTFTKGDTTTFTVDTKLEKIVANFKYEATSNSLVITYEDGTSDSIPLTALIDTYTSGSAASDMVKIAIDSASNKITATVTDGTITEAKLDSALQTKIGKIGENTYTLPTASTTTLGGVKIGNNLSVTSDGVVTANNVKMGSDAATAAACNIFLKIEA